MSSESAVDLLQRFPGGIGLQLDELLEELQPQLARFIAKTMKGYCEIDEFRSGARRARPDITEFVAPSLHQPPGDSRNK